MKPRTAACHMWMLLAASFASAQPSDTELAALDPRDANSYLRLGETVVDEADTPDEVRLARRLFVYALQIGRESDDPIQRALGASAALALAQDARTATERRWLYSMAGELEPELARGLDRGSAPPAWDWSVGLLAAEALGLARAGEGRDALKRLNEPSVRAVLAEVTPLLGVSGGGGAAGLVERLSRGWPCPECSNQRVTTRRRDGEVERSRCQTCLGNPGLRELTGQELSAHLRAELRLLNGSVRTWGAQLELDGGEPLREPSVSGLQRFYGVDPLARLWRDGQWVREPIPEPVAEPDPASTPPQEEPAHDQRIDQRIDQRTDQPSDATDG